MTHLHPGAGAESPEAKYLGCDPDQCADRARSASASLMISQATPPVLLVLGNEDKIVPPSQSEDFHQRMLDAGCTSEILEIDGVGHSFVGKDEASTRQASIRALNATIAFIERVTPPRT
jgi:dipeptidyl aminopeptidase/acylaminoacyl peptidase